MFRTFKHNLFSSTLQKENSLDGFQRASRTPAFKEQLISEKKAVCLVLPQCWIERTPRPSVSANSFEQFRVQASTAHELVDSGDESPRFNLILCSSSFCP